MKLQQLHESNTEIFEWIKKHLCVGYEDRVKLNGNKVERWTSLTKPRTWAPSGPEDNEQWIWVTFEIKGNVVDITNETTGSYDLYLQENPPFKIGKVKSVNIYLERFWDDVRTLPAENEYTLQWKASECKSLRGISKAMTGLNSGIYYDIDNGELSGMLELAMIEWKLIKFFDCSKLRVTSTVRKAAEMICQHYQEHGKGQKILELRKKLIDAGLERHV